VAESGDEDGCFHSEERKANGWLVAGSGALLYAAEHGRLRPSLVPLVVWLVAGVR